MSYERRKKTTLYILQCVQKKTCARFVLYLCGKCSDFYKIFREYLEVNKYSSGKKVKYSLLPVTSC